MSKAINSVFGGKVKADTSAGDSYLSFLNSVDTSAADGANTAMGQEALRLSQNLSSMPDIVYSVNGSDDARLRAEQATYQSYVDKLTPQFQTQMSDLETRLANQGLSVGSQAYQRAVNDLTNEQNTALNQAAYSSVLNGQQAYTQSLEDSINAANFSNNARSNTISEIYNLLQNSPSSYENQANIYAVRQGIAQQQAAAKQQSYNNAMSVLGAIKDTAAIAYGMNMGATTASQSGKKE